MNKINPGSSNNKGGIMNKRDMTKENKRLQTQIIYLKSIMAEAASQLLLAWDEYGGGDEDHNKLYEYLINPHEFKYNPYPNREEQVLRKTIQT